MQPRPTRSSDVSSRGALVAREPSQGLLDPVEARVEIVEARFELLVRLRLGLGGDAAGTAISARATNVDVIVAVRIAR